MIDNFKQIQTTKKKQFKKKRRKIKKFRNETTK